MKKQLLSFLSLIFIIVSFVSCGATQSAAEKEAKAMEISEKVNAPNFTFNATYAYPTGFKSMYLSPYYSMKVSADSVQVYLPYYGRAYSAPMDPREGGIKFISTDFDYKIDKGKKEGNWLVQIRTNDQSRLIILNLDIWSNGSARLFVTDPNRQPISFQGDIETESP